MDKVAIWQKIIDYEKKSYDARKNKKYPYLDMWEMVDLVKKEEGSGNILLEADNELDKDICGYISKLLEDDYKIVYNANHFVVRQRYTIAHELGHYVLHKSLLGDYGTNDDRAYRTRLSSEHYNRNITIEHENEANNFARHLLLPKQSIIEILGDQIEIQDIIRFNRYDKSEVMIKNDDWLSKNTIKLNVSKAVLQLRLRENDLNEYRGDNGYYS